MRPTGRVGKSPVRPRGKQSRGRGPPPGAFSRCPGTKPNLLPRKARGLEESPNGGEHFLQSPVMGSHPALEKGQMLPDLGIRTGEVAESDEAPDDERRSSRSPVSCSERMPP